jgi:hypothetical protein
MDSIEHDTPSRTITSRSRMPLPILKALYSVRENITLSNMSTPNHAEAASTPLGHYSLRSQMNKLTLTADAKTRHSRSSRIQRGICTYPLMGVYWLHPGTRDMTCIVSTSARRLPIIAHFCVQKKKKMVRRYGRAHSHPNAHIQRESTPFQTRRGFPEHDDFGRIAHRRGSGRGLFARGGVTYQGGGTNDGERTAGQRLHGKSEDLVVYR